jgi:hypothetical protein
MKDMAAPRAATRITVAADWQLIDDEFYIERVWKPARALNARMRSTASWLKSLTMLYEFDGQLYFADGAQYRHPEIDDVFQDGSNRWMGYFLEADETGQRPRRFSNKLERLRLIEAYCQIRLKEQTSA